MIWRGLSLIITYYGHSCLLVEHEGKRVIIDPFLSGNPATVIQPSQLQVDAVILTHAHDDHFGDTVEISTRNDCPVIATFELASYCEQRGLRTHAMNTGGSFRFDGFAVKMTPAFHTSSLRVGDQYLYAGEPVGILLSMGDKTLYHAGDTALFSDMKWIGQRNTIDVAALPIGDNYTMGPEDAAIAAEWLQARHVIPIHFNTFPVIEQDAEQFKQRVEAQGIGCHPLHYGQVLPIS